MTTIVEEDVVVDRAVMGTTSGEVRMVYHSSMAASESAKHAGRMAKICRFMPSFAEGPGMWILKFPYVASQLQSPADSGFVVESVASKKRRIESRSVDSLAPPAKKPVRVLKDYASQSIPLTLGMTEKLFESEFVAKVLDAARQMEALQKDDELNGSTKKRNAFVPACFLKGVINKVQTTIEFGINITNFAFVRQKVTGEAGNFESGPCLLAQIMLREEKEDKPIMHFSAPVSEITDMLDHPLMNRFVSKWAAKHEKASTEKLEAGGEEQPKTVGKEIIETEAESENDEEEYEEEEEENESQYQ